MAIETFDGSAADVLAREIRLKADGYQLTGKRREKDLLPGEYLTRTYVGNETSFVGSSSATIVWSPK